MMLTDSFLDELVKISFLSDGGYLVDQIGKPKVRKQSAMPPEDSLKVKEGMIPTSSTPMGTTGMQAQAKLMKNQQVGTLEDKNSVQFKPLNQASKGPKVPGVPNSSGSSSSTVTAKAAAAMAKWAFSESGFGPTGGVFRPQYESYQGAVPIPSPVMMDPNIKQSGDGPPPSRKKKLAFDQSGFGMANQIAAYGGNGGYHESYQGSIPLPAVVALDPHIKRAGNAPMRKRAGIPLTPKGRFASASREGKPKQTGFTGPSVADTAKPIGYGRDLPGAKKTGI